MNNWLDDQMTRLIAWLGGGVFVASLAVTGWWYFVAAGRASAFEGWTPAAVDACLVTLFARRFQRDYGEAPIAGNDAVLHPLSFIPCRSSLNDTALG